MQAAGIARSWRSNRTTAYQQYQDALERYQHKRADGQLSAKAKEPEFREWNVPTLREPCLQANVNVVKLQASQASTYDYWLTISTLEKGQPIAVPVKLAEYHKRALTDPKTQQAKKLNSSVQLNKHEGVWWLTLSYDEEVTIQTPPAAPVVGIDVGIANFVTTSTGKHLPSTSSRSGQKLIRHTQHEINHAVNQCFADPEHESVQFAYERLSVSSMRFKVRAQNAYVRASHLVHIPQQILWNSQKRGVQATAVISAYSSQECSVCHYTDRQNRPKQQTFCCQVCGFETHADHNASINISRRVGDTALRACRDRSAIKALLMKRHEAWRQQQGRENTRLVKRRRRGTSSAAASFT
jgi:hypothetical protein